MGDREEGEGKWETGKRDRGKWEKKMKWKKGISAYQNRCLLIT